MGVDTGTGNHATLPIVINIDVCGLCNESCNYCPRSASYPNKKEYMSVELFSKFINDCKDYRGVICFTGRGENSLHPNFKELVEILHFTGRKYKTRILTNGYKLKEKFEWFNMFDSLVINSYASKEQMEARKKLMPRAIHRYWDQSMKPEDWGETPIQVQNRTELYERIATDRSEINTPCTFPASKGWIHHDGTIQLCCNDWTDTNIFGNIATDNFFDVFWKNEELQKLKQELLDGNRRANPICTNCNRKLNKQELRSRLYYLNPKAVKREWND
jgi:MoaA/NifB/PqqE/SkfB family radical SAM enzyme